MHSSSQVFLGLLSFASISLAAAGCSQTICKEGSTGSCEVNESSADAGGGSATCNDPNEISCSGVCVDTDIDPSFCGNCATSCDTGQGCSDGACADRCAAGEVLCNDNCIVPQTNADFCGAAGTCSGGDSGADCGDETCSDGVCTAAARYLGSLTPSLGRWSYGASLGVAGAEEACRTTFSAPAAIICSPSDLSAAAGQGELANPMDSAGTPVTSWFALDPTANASLQCANPDEASVPWTYETQHRKQGARYLTVNAAGILSQVQDQLIAGCEASRWVACCNP